jgi:hypothetical protein
VVEADDEAAEAATAASGERGKPRDEDEDGQQPREDAAKAGRSQTLLGVLSGDSGRRTGRGWSGTSAALGSGIG